MPSHRIRLAAALLLLAAPLGCDDRPPPDAEPPPVVMVRERAPAAAEPAAAPCDADDADDRWVVELRDRVVAHGEIARFAAERFGPPAGCHGAVTSRFDGLEFGTLRLDYAGGAWLELETMPIETSVTKLELPAGFASEDEARALLDRHARGMGLELDWSRPQSMTVDGRTTTVVWDPEPGLNASGRLVASDGAVRRIELSLAL